MPELPEVETVRLGITPHSLNQTIQKIIVRNRQLRWRIPDELEQSAQNQIITAINRRGKYLLIQSAAGTIIIHLGMSGVLMVVNKNTPLKKHDHFDIILKNQKILRLNDPRRFGCVLWTTNDPLQHRLLRNMAPEPLTKAFNHRYLTRVFATKSIIIKKAIMDNKIVVGVGNIYASECLFKAKINPETITKTLDEAKIKALISAIKTILKQAIKSGGTTLKDFTQSDGKPGYFAQDLSVYGRDNQPCKNCKTLIKKIIISNRASYFCPACQGLS